MNTRANIQGFEVDLLTFDEVIKSSFKAVEEGRNLHIVTINPEIIQSAKKNPKLFEIIHDAEIITPDGVGIKLALKFKGINQEQVTGVDLSLKILEMCAALGIKVAFIGAKKDILELAVKNAEEKFPGLQIAYKHDGYFSEFDEIVKNVIESHASFVLCAMGSPKQEYFIYELKKKIKGAVMIGVGGTFDVISGNVKLAPKIYRKLGLEWLYRTIKQPERFKRIFPTLPIFFFHSIIDSIRK